MVLYEVFVEFQKDFLKVDGNQITIGIKSKPIRGQANKEIIKKISKYFGISSSCVTIRTGHKTEKKIVEVLN
ncbi:MAG: DUF167 domain-containing protein [Nitrososphaerota archaeon]|jgi:hypothetical protein|nr:DUF167 domain-containing protein [Nitrososphaerota archaeon]MCH8996144.1 DUF167 domain-containing protein [Nitrososphaerota archaeon]MDG7054333.1 DUF167 domain-containing protein [Nitrososphaerota archaeon]